MTDEQKIRAARRLVDEVLAGPTGRFPLMGQQLRVCRQILGAIGGDDPEGDAAGPEQREQKQHGK